MRHPHSRNETARGARWKLSDTDGACKHSTYFRNNQGPMDYGRYRAADWPIRSGSVEGQCKFVVGRRFKGNGMRWRPHDNDAHPPRRAER